MALTLVSFPTLLPRPAAPAASLFPLPTTSAIPHFVRPRPRAPGFQSLRATASDGDDVRGDGAGGDRASSALLGAELLRRVSAAKDADHVADLVAGEGVGGGRVGVEDSCLIIGAALERGNVDLALSVYSAMRAATVRGEIEDGTSSVVGVWKWATPDARTHALLVRGLAAASRVSDAIRIVGSVARVGISQGEEVPFGKIIRCPICTVAIAVAQPQNGFQAASCSKCCYQYELFSGDVTSIESEELSMEISAWEKGLRLLQIMKKSIPAAVHSIVVRTPSGIARTHRFATKTVELPAQEGERITICLADSSDVARVFGPFKFNARSPEFNAGEPLSLTNHISGQQSQLLRAPPKDRKSFLLNPSILFPALVLLASGDAASGFIDPNLPKTISFAVAASVALGTTVNLFVLPQLNQLPQRIVDVVAIKQQLLAQYDMLQIRIKDLILAAEKEIWMLARMCQLEKKIVAVGEPSYRARRGRVKRVRESLEKSLTGRIELIESYAKISSMIEIEVEMDSNVLAAEAASNAESISEQIQDIMEIENLEERWRIQAEANDEVERLLSSQPLSPEHV